MDTFLARYLTYDEDMRVAYQGRERRKLTPEELYSVLGRDDLVKGVEARRASRLWFYLGGAALGVVGVGVGGYLYATTPYVNTLACHNTTEAYNQCVDASHTQQVVAGAAIAVGLLGGAVLAGLGYTRSVDPIPADETYRLVNDYNVALRNKAKSPGAGVFESLRFGVAVAPGGAQAGVSGAF